MSQTNATTNDILKFLFSAHVWVWRQNVLPIPVERDGQIVSFRPGSKVGLPDIMGSIGPGLLTGSGRVYGVPCYIEVKTGRDKLRPEQIGFQSNARDFGCVHMVVKDYADFLRQWEALPWVK